LNILNSICKDHDEFLGFRAERGFANRGSGAGRDAGLQRVRRSTVDVPLAGHSLVAEAALQPRRPLRSRLRRRRGAPLRLPDRRLPNSTRGTPGSSSRVFFSSRSAAQTGLHRVALREGAFDQWPERGERGAVPETS
jgi:hypothetical protein